MERTSKRVTTDVILIAVSQYYKIPVWKITSKTRKRGVMIPRQMAHYLAYTLKVDSLSSIAVATGVTHHATVIHSFSTVKQERKLYPYKEQEVRDILHNIREMGYDTTIKRSKKRYVYANDVWV